MICFATKFEFDTIKGNYAVDIALERTQSLDLITFTRKC